MANRARALGHAPARRAARRRGIVHGLSSSASDLLTATASHRPKALAAIALFKIAKACACVVLAASAWHLLRPDVAERFDQWLASLTWAARYGIIARAIDWLVALGPGQWRTFGLAAVVYAVLYAVQGFGLWFGKRWAEYLVVIETGLLLPLEIYELVHHASLVKGVILVANIAIVIYLVHVLRKPRSQGA